MARTRAVEKFTRAMQLRSAGHTQAETARVVGVTIRTVRRWEAELADGEQGALDALEASTWSAYERERNEQRRGRLLQGLLRAAIARAKAAEVRYITAFTASPTPTKTSTSAADGGATLGEFSPQPR